jgi:hypothetical protein
MGCPVSPRAPGSRSHDLVPVGHLRAGAAPLVSEFAFAGACACQPATVPTGPVAATQPVSMRGSASMARRSGSGPAR